MAPRAGGRPRPKSAAAAVTAARRQSGRAVDPAPCVAWRRNEEERSFASMLPQSHAPALEAAGESRTGNPGPTFGTLVLVVAAPLVAHRRDAVERGHLGPEILLALGKLRGDAGGVEAADRREERQDDVRELVDQQGDVVIPGRDAVEDDPEDHADDILDFLEVAGEPDEKGLAHPLGHHRRRGALGVAGDHPPLLQLEELVDLDPDADVDGDIAVLDLLGHPLELLG